jgi:hypothetical protein
MMNEGNSAIIVSSEEQGKPGRPTKYDPQTVDKLLAALRAGLTHKQACLACGIAQSTLADWRERYSDLEPLMDAAREEARQKALEGIKDAGQKDWRALAEWLKLTFPEHRQGHNINVSATAGAAMQMSCTDEERRKLIAMRERALSEAVAVTIEPPKPASAAARELGEG